MTLRYGSVCSGIEAASVAWEPLGWVPVFFSEIDPFPCEVLAEHHGSGRPFHMPSPLDPDIDAKERTRRAAAIKSVGDLPPFGGNGVPNYGDMTKFKEWPDAAIDILVGGTPCQAFSVAGLRKGLDDPRGNLTLVFLGLVERYRPQWVVWENVPGVLSQDGGGAFASFLGGLAELGYGCAYRVLDAQYVRMDGYPRAVPQRRRRVFVVGHSGGDWRRSAGVLFEPEGLRGDSPPRRQARKDVAPTISSRSSGGGGLGTDFDLDGGLICVDVAPALNAHFGEKQGLEDQHINGGDCSFPHVSLRLNAGAMGRSDAETETLIPVNRCGFDDVHAPDVAQTLTRGAESAGKGGYAGRRQEDDANLVAHALRGISDYGDGNPSLRAEGGDCGGGSEALVSHTLRADGFDASEDGTGRGVPIVPIAFPERMSATQYGAMADVSPALTALNPTAVAFAQNTRDEVRLVGGDGAVAGALAAEAGMKQQTYVAEPFTLAVRGRGDGHELEYRQDGTANAILTPNGGRAGIGVGAIALEWAVRRLTPTECERLQGFPDGRTAIIRKASRTISPKMALYLAKRGLPVWFDNRGRWRTNVAADGPRYKALGNSMACNVMRWIGARIALMQAEIEQVRHER